MTALVSWVAYDERGPASAYIATDSRISFHGRPWRGGWDGVRKCFASSAFPDLFAYVGDVLLPSLVLGQYVDALDAGFVAPRDSDLSYRHASLVEAVRAAIDAHPSPRDVRKFKVLHLGRTAMGMTSTFTLHTISWDGAKIRTAPQTSLDQDSVVELGAADVRAANAPVVDGSGVDVVEDAIAIWQGSKQSDTSRAVFSALCDAVRSGAEPTVGGPVQLVGLYRIRNGQTLGVVTDRGATALGMHVGGASDSDLEYRNELFERVDSGGRLVHGAKRHTPAGQPNSDRAP